MHHINGSFTTYTNVKRKRSGHLFQGRFKSIVIDKDGYLLELSRYLHLNPLRAKIVEKPEEYQYSSYVAYITAQGEEIVTRSNILGMFNTSEGEARKRYKIFVENALGEKAESPIKKVYGGMILGGESFIRDILKKIEEGQLEKEAVSYRRTLRSSVGTETVLSEVCKYLGISREEVTNADQGNVRKICVYLLKKHTVATTREVGALLGNMSYAAAAKMYQRFAKDLAADEPLRRVVEGLSKKISLVEG